MGDIWPVETAHQQSPKVILWKTFKGSGQTWSDLVKQKAQKLKVVVY